MSKEHLFPKKVREKAQKLSEGHGRGRRLSFSSEITLPEYNFHMPERRIEKAVGGADLQNQTLEILCKNCNNTFSGRIQELAQDALISLLDRKIPPDDQIEALRNWISLFCISISTDISGENPISEETRLRFRRDRSIDNLRIFLGAGSLPCSALSYSRVFCSHEIAIPPDSAMEAMEQTIMIYFGYLFLFIYFVDYHRPIGMRVSKMAIDPDQIRRRFCIFPLENVCYLSNFQVLSVQQMDDIIYAIPKARQKKYVPFLTHLKED